MKKQPEKKSKAPVKVAEAKPKVTRTKANAFSVNLTEEQRELVRTVTADLCVKGWSNYAIAKHISEVYELSVSNKTVGKYYDEILKEWRAERLDKVDDLYDMIILEIKGYDRVEREAWEAWEKSKKDKTKTSKKYFGLPVSKDVINTIKVENNEEVLEVDGNPKFLEIINQCKEKRSLLILKLYGSTPEENTGNTGNTVTNYVQQNIQVNIVERRKPLTDADIQDVIQE